MGELWEKYCEILNNITWNQAKNCAEDLEEKIQIMYENMVRAMDQVFSKKLGKSKGNKIPKKV